MDIPYIRVRDGIVIEVRVLPRSSRKEIVGVTDNVVKVKLTAPPVDGAANEQLIELLSEEFHIRKSDVIVLKGETSRTKKIKLIGVKL